MTDWRKNFPEQEGKEFVFGHYGYSPTIVHRNPDLSPGAKGLYSYLSTFVNAEQMKQGKLHAWPSRKRILKEMNISVNTFGKYLKELKEANLIHVEQGRQTLKKGKQGFGNNLYIFQTYVTSPSAAEKPLVTEDCGSKENSHSKSDRSKPCDTQQVNTSNTQGFSITKNKSNNKFSTTRQEACQSQGRIIALEACPNPKEEIDLDDFVDFWNQAGVNPHHRLGQNTRARIKSALDTALEDYPLGQLLGTITTYAKLYRGRKARHKYRLVEFLEKRGYEHFLEEENWERLAPRKVARADFTYRESRQDLSLFPWLNPDGQEGGALDSPLDST